MGSEVLKQIASGKANRTGQYIKPWAQYRFKVDALKAFIGNEGGIFVSEMTVISMSPTIPAEQLAKLPAAQQPNAVGSSASYIVNLSKKSGPGNVLSFLMALFNEPESEFTGAQGEAALEELTKDPAEGGKQPAAGMQIIADVYEKPQRGDKSKMFTYFRWTHVAPETK